VLLLGLALADDCETLVVPRDGCITTTLMALREAGCEARLKALGLTLTLERPPPPPPAPDKQTRDAYGVPNSLESENFVLRWGSGVSTTLAQQVLDAFEDGWQTQITEMDYPGPYGTDGFKFNVYVGDTGGNTPDSFGNAGYFFEDPDGWPMIVLSETTVQNIDDYGKTTTVHEFFHAIQEITDAPYGYGSGVPGSWYYEATASWIEVEVFPDEESYADFLFGFSFFPHLSVNYFDYPDGSAGLEEYHQYGAFIFIRYLAEHVGGWEIIRLSWVEADHEDPLEVLDGILRQDFDTVLRNAFFDFASRNVAWDYEDGDLYSQVHEQYADGYPNDDQRIAASHTVSTDGWVDAPEETLPWRLGTNYIRLFPQDQGPDLHVQFEGDPTGEWASNAAWNVQAVLLREGEDAEYWEIELDDRAADAWIENSASADEVWLVVSVSTGEEIPGEQFAYRYALEPGETETDDNGENIATVCACTTTRPLTGWVLLLSGAVLLGRRR